MFIEFMYYLCPINQTPPYTMKPNIFPIGLAIIGIVTIALMYFFPIYVLWISLSIALVSAIFVGIVIYKSENAPANDQDFDVKFRRDGHE